MTSQRMIKAVAGEDLAAAGEILVYADGTDDEKVKAQASATSTESLGILCGGRNKDDDEVDVVVEGFTFATAGGPIEPMDYLMAATGGKVQAATTGNVIIGQYIPVTQRDAADGDRIRIHLHADKTRLVA